MLNTEAQLGSKVFELCTNLAESNTLVSFKITAISKKHGTDCKICYKTNCQGQSSKKNFKKFCNADGPTGEAGSILFYKGTIQIGMDLWRSPNQNICSKQG